MDITVERFEDFRLIQNVAVLGAGNGGKAVAADLALQGLNVRLFEWAEYRANIAELLETPVIRAAGVIEGEARLSLVTTDLAEAIEDAEVIIACLQGLAHARLATELAPIIRDGAILVLNPGSTGGALELRRIFSEHRIDKYLLLCETGTLTHCCRARGPREVQIGLRVNHVAFAALPGVATADLHRALQPIFPGLRAKRDVLEVALCNGNPVIHPAIMLANAAIIEQRGADHRFYREGVTPAVARIIESVDRERMALGKALGYDLLSEPRMCLEQGYSQSEDYLECYAGSPVFGDLASPPGMEHRYLHEDCGLGLVTYVSLGKLLGVPTPVSRSLATLAGTVTGRNYLKDGRRTVERLGLAGMDETAREEYLQAPRRIGGLGT